MNMNNEVNSKYLPVGSVVLLKDAKKKLVITGFMVYGAGDNKQVFDYSGCLYPEGVIDSNQTAVFNHNQIEKIIYLGYIDEEEKQFKIKLNSLVQNLNENRQNSNNDGNI